MRYRGGVLYKFFSNQAFLLPLALAVVVLAGLALVSTRYSKKSSSVPSEVLQATNNRPIIVDHNSISLFESIPPQYLEAAKNLRMMYSDRSVGQNINESLNCLTATSWGTSNNACRVDYYNSNWNWKTFSERDRLAGTVPSRILFTPDPVKYDRSNWTFVAKGGTWDELTKDFVTVLAPSYLATKDVLSYQFSYLNVRETDSISNPTTGFWANTSKYDIYDLENFISANGNKVFIFWTTSLARGIGSQVATDFNQRMRDYARQNNKILFDVADIESFTDTGEPCYDNRDGVPYTSQVGQTENYPNDGFDYPAVCQDYTTEIDGGHLGSVSAGGLRLAKGFWVLMAQIAGWDPYGESLPTPTSANSGGQGDPNPTETPIATITLSPTRYPTATSIPLTPTPYPTATSIPLTPTPTAMSTTNVHVGDIDGLVKVVNGGWQARAVVYPHTQSHSLIIGATVRGRFSSVPGIVVTCVTNNSGWCPMDTPTRLGYDVYSDTFTIESITVSGMGYYSTANHDIDGTSNGNTITISR